MASAKNDYFGLERVISLILAIIPVTSLVCGILTRFQEKAYVAAIIRIFFGWNIFWIVDLVSMIIYGKMFRFLNC